MDYKELSDMCRYLSDTPSYTAFHDKVEREIICDSCNGGLCYDKVKDAHWCMYEALQRASVAITELIERAENAEKIVDEYAESARAIALWLSAYCDKTLSYPSMISNAARKISVAYADMEKRAEQAEKERDDYKELFFAYKHVCGGVSPDRIGELVEADKDGKAIVAPARIGDKVYHITMCESFPQVYDGTLYGDDGGYGSATGLYCPCELAENCPFPCEKDGSFDCDKHRKTLAVFEDVVKDIVIGDNLDYVGLEYSGAADFDEFGKYIFSNRESAEAALEKEKRDGQKESSQD